MASNTEKVNLEENNHDENDTFAEDFITKHTNETTTGRVPVELKFNEYRRSHLFSLKKDAPQSCDDNAEYAVDKTSRENIHHEEDKILMGNTRRRLEQFENL